MRVCPRCGAETDAAMCPHDGTTTVSPSTAIATYPAGTVIDGRYRIEEVLGIGGFGAVYKCTQLNMEQFVAVKILKNEHIRSDEHIKRFVREAQAASKLNHPNTIQIFDFGRHTDDALFLAMEYLQGETLAQRLDREVRMTMAQVAHILSQICHSLTEAHINGLIHRDLKPENIMLLKVAGDDSFVKVLDFGIAAKLADENNYDEKLTEMGMIMGTPSYMSPEQAHGKPLDARCDIYSLGVLMYEMMTGRVPFEGDAPMTVLVKHINDPAVPPRELVPDADISRAMEQVALRCLEKEPVLRPQSCAEMAEMLSKALKEPDNGLSRGPGSSSADGRGQTQGYSLAGEMTEPVAELAAGQIDPFRTQAVSSSTSRSSARPSSRGYVAGQGSKTPLWLGLGALGLVAAAVVALALLIPGQTPGAMAGRTVGLGADVSAGDRTDRRQTEAMVERAVAAAAKKAAAEAAKRVTAEAARVAAEKLAAQQVAAAAAKRAADAAAAKAEGGRDAAAARRAGARSKSAAAKAAAAKVAAGKTAEKQAAALKASATQATAAAKAAKAAKAARKAAAAKAASPKPINRNDFRIK